jgi:hypothetical protein
MSSTATKKETTMNRRRATINKKPTLSRAIAAIAGVAIASSLFALPAAAAKPANQACIGTSFSALAGPRFGQGVVSFAQQPGPPGLGDGIQALQAGSVSDLVVPNTCNDS